MYSLYQSLLNQHPRQLTPVRSSVSTITRLKTCLEEVVLENGLGALVIESLSGAEDRAAVEGIRLKKVAEVARNVILFLTPKDSLAEQLPEKVLVLDKASGDAESFVVIADTRFSALLVATMSRTERKDPDSASAFWTFEPDVVYSALEYLMARVQAEHPDHTSTIAEAVRVSTPKETSLPLSLGVTTKLARLLQEQTEREIALNRIATAIRNSLNLDLNCLLQTAVNEVGSALNATYCVVQIEGELVGNTRTEWFFNSDGMVSEEAEDALSRDIELAKSNLHETLKLSLTEAVGLDNTLCAQASVPLLYNGSYVGLLLAQFHGLRTWAHNELMLLHTVADQLTVAVNQAHLFEQLQVQALSDGLTGCYNRRAFEMQLERDLHLAIRMRQPLSLIMIDADNFKLINDRAGHHVGDVALRIVADCLRKELRAVDSASRFGGDEFAVILPQADKRGARIVAERLRKRIAETEIPGYGLMTASFGCATFPLHASSRDTLVIAADRALYCSKAAGRNQVNSPPAESNGRIEARSSSKIAVEEELVSN